MTNPVQPHALRAASPRLQLASRLRVLRNRDTQ